MLSCIILIPYNPQEPERFSCCHCGCSRGGSGVDLKDSSECHQTHPDVARLQAAMFSVCCSLVGKSFLDFQSRTKVSSRMKEQLLYHPSFLLSPGTATELGGRGGFFIQKQEYWQLISARGTRWSLVILRHPLTSISLATCGRLCGVFPVLWQAWF